MKKMKNEMALTPNQTDFQRLSSFLQVMKSFKSFNRRYVNQMDNRVGDININRQQYIVGDLSSTTQKTACKEETGTRKITQT